MLHSRWSSFNIEPEEDRCSWIRWGSWSASDAWNRRLALSTAVALVVGFVLVALQPSFVVHGGEDGRLSCRRLFCFVCVCFVVMLTRHAWKSHLS